MSPSRRQSQPNRLADGIAEESETKRYRRSRSSDESVTRNQMEQDHHSRHDHYGNGTNSTSPTSPQDETFSTSPTSSRAGLSRGGRPESLTVRRREANRLAAQRFRSRKKGYQESLEEKVQELQEENALLLGRLEGRQDVYGNGQAEQPRPRPLPRSSTEWATHGTAAEIRMAALDSANRRLQEENRALEEEIQRVTIELEMWRRWANQHPQKPTPPQEPQPPFIRAQSHDAVPRPLPVFSDIRSGLSMTNNHMSPPILPPPLTIPGVSSGYSSASSTTSVRLPPMRMTPPSSGHPVLPSSNLPAPLGLSPIDTKPKPPLG